MMESIRIENLSIGYRKQSLISDINLELCRGEITAMIGRNGAGKSTLLKTITGILKPISGKIYIEGQPAETITKRERARLIAVVSTAMYNAGGLRLHELVSLGRSPYTGALGLLTKKDTEIVDDVIEVVGLRHKANSFVSELSDGERQKAMIARALAQEAPVLIMDEPFSFLDVATRLEMTSLISRLAKNGNKAILYSSHDVSLALKTVDNIWAFCRNGDKDDITSGTPQQIIETGVADRIFDTTEVKFDRETKEFILK